MFEALLVLLVIAVAVAIFCFAVAHRRDRRAEKLEEETPQRPQQPSPKLPSRRVDAIRKICEDTNGEATYATGRALLAEAGFSVPQDVGRRSEHLKNLDRHDLDYEADDIIDTICHLLKVDTKTACAVMEESLAHIAYKADRNHWDVTKYMWKQRFAPRKMPQQRFAPRRVVKPKKDVPNDVILVMPGQPVKTDSD